ncbi:MAG: PAS-domain containing protein [Hyphomicrobiaceae bacterium]|nr:PAS-domain containing protein [Hyphomicrobiaceae bacterium]
MRSTTLKSRNVATPAVGELLALACVSIATVLVIALGFATGDRLIDIVPPERISLIGLISAVFLLLGATALQVVRAARLATTDIRAENHRLQRRLASAEGILRAEPQVLIYWEPGEELQIMNHSLIGVPGLPDNNPDLLRFGKWLEAGAAADLKAGLDALFEHGRAFNMIVKTRGGGHLEAEGRTAGGRAVLRLRDVIGYKRDLARIIDQHQRLRDDNDACRALIDNLPSPVWFRGADGRLSWVNRAYWTAVDATSSAEVIERQIELLEMRQRQAVTRSVQRGDAYRDRAELLLRGDLKPHELVVLPVASYQAAVALDVGAVEEAQGELDRRSAAYERTLDKVATAVAIFSADRRLTYFNEAYIKLWGLEPSFLKTRPGETVLLDKLRDAGRLPGTTNYRDWRARFLTAMRTSPNAEETWHLPDGRTMQVMAETRDDGGITYLYVDQTQKLELESRFNQQLTTQRETLDSLTEGVAVFGTDGRLKFNNAAFARIWNVPHSLAETKPHIAEVIERANTLYTDGETWDTLRGVLTGFAERRDAVSGTMTRTDQSLIAYSAMPLPDGATLLTFTDVTDSKRYERLLEERNESLEATSELKNRFISHVSYELRTPLTTIIGFNDMLSSPLIGSLNPKQREYLADITSSSKALLALVDNILDLATIDAGAMELNSGVVSVARVIDDAIEGVRDRAIQSKLTIDIGLAQDATTFVADEARVRQVLYNLISNAVGFSRQGDAILISAWRDNGAMNFAVEDHGFGIPDDQLSRIFERFESQAHGSGHRGTGLGLSIVKSLVDLHKGTIQVKSVQGQGTRVVVAFPDATDVRRGANPSSIDTSLPQIFIPRLKSQ